MWESRRKTGKSLCNRKHTVYPSLYVIVSKSPESLSLSVLYSTVLYWPLSLTLILPFSVSVILQETRALLVIIMSHFVLASATVWQNECEDGMNNIGLWTQQWGLKDLFIMDVIIIKHLTWTKYEIKWMKQTVNLKWYHYIYGYIYNWTINNKKKRIHAIYAHISLNFFFFFYSHITAFICVFIYSFIYLFWL